MISHEINSSLTKEKEPADSQVIWKRVFFAENPKTELLLYAVAQILLLFLCFDFCVQSFQTVGYVFHVPNSKQRLLILQMLHLKKEAKWNYFSDLSVFFLDNKNRLT